MAPSFYKVGCAEPISHILSNTPFEDRLNELLHSKAVSASELFFMIAPAPVFDSYMIYEDEVLTSYDETFLKSTFNPLDDESVKSGSDGRFTFDSATWDVGFYSYDLERSPSKYKNNAEFLAAFEK